MSTEFMASNIEDHCIETEFEETTRTAFGVVYKTGYKSTDPMPDWMGDDAYIQLTPELGDTTGGPIQANLEGLSDDAKQKIMDAGRTPVFWRVIRLNGVWTRVSYTTDGRYIFAPLTEDEYDAVLDYDGGEQPDVNPPPRTKNMVRAAYNPKRIYNGTIPSRRSEGYAFGSDRAGAWLKDVETWNNARSYLSAAPPQHEMMRRHFAGLEKRVAYWEAKGRQDKADKLKRDGGAGLPGLDAKDETLAEQDANIATFTARFTKATARLRDWEDGTDPDAKTHSGAEILRLNKNIGKWRRERSWSIEDMEDYRRDRNDELVKVCQAEVADFDEKISTATARIQQLQSI